MASIAQPENTEAMQRRKLIMAGQIAFLPTGILNTLLWPMLPILAARWALNDRQAGNLFLVQFLAQLVGVQGSGVMLARVGFRPAFLTGLLLMAGGVGTLYLGTAWLGFLSVAVYGLGLGLLIPTDNLMVAEISPDSRAAAVSLLNFFWGVGAVLGSLLVGWAQAHHLVPALLGSISVFLVLLALGVRNLAYPSAATKKDSPVAWAAMLKNPIIWLFAIVFFFYPGAEAAVGGWIGTYATRMGMLKATAALIPAVFLAALTLGRGAGGVLLRSVPEQWILRVGYGLGAAGIALLLRSSTMSAVIASAMIIGFSFAMVYPIVVARLSHHFGVQARSIGAVMFSIAAVGPAVLPWLVGVVSQSTGSLRAGLIVPLISIAILFLVHIRKW